MSSDPWYHPVAGTLFAVGLVIVVFAAFMGVVMAAEWVYDTHGQAALVGAGVAFGVGLILLGLLIGFGGDYLTGRREVPADA